MSPTSGVGIRLARRQFWSVINDFARRGTAHLWWTPTYLEEAEQCNRALLHWWRPKM